MHDHQNLMKIPRWRRTHFRGIVEGKLKLLCFYTKREKLLTINKIYLIKFFSWVPTLLFTSIYTTNKPVSIVQVITEIVLNLKIQECLHRIDSSGSFALTDC